MNQSGATHPSPEQLTAFVRGQLDDDAQIVVEEHILNCEDCVHYLRSISEDDLFLRIKSADTSMFDPASATRIQPTGDSLGEESQLPGQTDYGELSREVLTALATHPRYKIDRLLGAGGMGVVYRAEHRLMERPVAIKVIAPRLINQTKTVERFRQEVKAAAKLSHRNIVVAYDADQVGSLHFLVMEFVEGTSLDLLVRDKGRLPIKRACSYILQAALGLQHAHENGMVHRDIKPQNLMLTPEGVIKILDFGLARLATENDDENKTELTAVGVTVGTPDYISPEQARNSRKVDARADLYSLGCTFYFLLTGQPPFPEGSALEKVVAHIERKPVQVTQRRKEVPEAVSTILHRMLEKDAAKRYQTPADVAEDLKSYLRRSTVGPSTTSEEQSAPLISINTQIENSKGSRPQSKDKPRSTILAGGVFVVLLICGLLLWWMSEDVSKKPNKGPVENPLATKPTNPDETEPQPGWNSLLPQINERQSLSGSWTRFGGDLEVVSEREGHLALPFPAPAEYDLEVTFTRWSGQHSIVLIFTAGSGQATFEVDAWETNLAGIQLIDGLQLNQRTDDVVTRAIENGRRYEMRLQVRRDSVEGYLDGALVTRYQGDGSNLSLLPMWDLGDSTALGIGAYQGRTTFHAVRLRPIALAP